MAAWIIRRHTMSARAIFFNFILKIYTTFILYLIRDVMGVKKRTVYQFR